MSELLREYVKKAMHGLSGNKRTIFSREFIEDAYPFDEPFGSLSQLEAEPSIWRIVWVATIGRCWQYMEQHARLMAFYFMSVPEWTKGDAEIRFGVVLQTNTLDFAGSNPVRTFHFVVFANRKVRPRL